MSSHPNTRDRPVVSGASRFFRALVATVVAAAVILPFSPVQSAAADLPEKLVGIHKSADPAPPHSISPGEHVVFTIDFNCGDILFGCANFAVLDSLPSPLVLGEVEVLDDLDHVITKTGNAFKVLFTEPLIDGTFGLDGGNGYAISVTATLPLGVDAVWDNQEVTNTAKIELDNPTTSDSTLESSANVLFDIPTLPSASLVKTVTPSTAFAQVGAQVEFALAATNDSNSAVDELVIQDPAAPASNAFDYLAVQSIADFAFPSGADQVQIDWYDASLGWQIGTPQSSPTLPPDLAAIKGLRFTFSSSTGNTIAKGAVASLTIVTTQTAAVSTIDPAVTIDNEAFSYVRVNGSQSSDDYADDSIVITKSVVGPTAVKTIVEDSVVGGTDVTVTIGGANSGNFPIKSMTITEPKVGTSTFAEQGIAFEAWNETSPNFEWPVGATAASVIYFYDYAAAAPVTAAPADPFPAPDPLAGTVTGFAITFSGVMAVGQYASLPYRASTEPVSADITTRDTIQVDVITTDDQTGSADAHADLTRRTKRINTSVLKLITPSSIYSGTGASTIVSLPAQVDGYPTALVDPLNPLPSDTEGSTIGVTSLVVDDNDPRFWNTFNVSNIVSTAVSSGVTLNIYYWDKLTSTWIPLDAAATMGITGATTFSYAVPVELRDDIAGLRFEYLPTDPDALLNPHFQVQPNFKAVLRENFRDGSGPVTDPDAVDVTVVDNQVRSTVYNDDATPTTATDTAVDDITLIPIPGGDGPDMVDKEWLDDTVDARTSDEATARLSWGTGGFEYPTVVITDTNADPALANVSNTVFDAFDLVRIPAIDNALDPRAKFDSFEVQFFYEGAWHSADHGTCLLTVVAPACVGGFPAYTLSDNERDKSTGVRFIVHESPNRLAQTSGPLDPLVGTGVATSMDLSRHIDLTFRVRDERRSDGDDGVAGDDPVLGTTRGTIYNTATGGEVSNSVRVDGLDGPDVLDAVIHTNSDSDEILIIDQPLSVIATKQWSDGTSSPAFGVPPNGTPQEFFPEATLTMTGTNTSVANVNELSLAEPWLGVNSTGVSAFDFVTITDIASIAVPAEALATQVVLDHSGATPDEVTDIATALAKTELQLVDVIGITVTSTGRIENSSQIRIVLHTQLREFVRGTPSTRVDTSYLKIDNTVRATITDPGGTDTDRPDGQLNVTIPGYASDSIPIEAREFGVIATKVINADTVSTDGVLPDDTSDDIAAIQYDEDGNRLATVTLSGQPTGNVRATQMVIEDSTPGFWNAYDFKGFGPGNTGTQSPINRVQVDVLVGVTYDLVGNTVTPLCAGSPVLDDCWRTTANPTSSLPSVPDLPSGYGLADIRGVRFTYYLDPHATWERPFNPRQFVSFTVSRRNSLVAPVTEVPSTLFTYGTPAPNETTVGTYTNEVTVTASSRTSLGGSLLWPEASDTASAAIRFQHLPAKVAIKKTPWGAYSLGQDIPYKIEVTNTGSTGGHNRALGDLVVTDVIDSDMYGPKLVIPEDPDTLQPYTPQNAFTYSLVNEHGAAQPAPTVSVTALPDSTQFTFTLVTPAALPVGWVLTINTTMRFRDQLEANVDVLNTATVKADQPFDTCDYWEDTNQKTQTTNTYTCTTFTNTRPYASAPLNIVKGVKGVLAGPLYAANGSPLDGGDGTTSTFDDLGVLRMITNSTIDCTNPDMKLNLDDAQPEYYRYPCVPVTRPGGLEEWAARFTNSGNVSVREIVAIDVLPTHNDTGVVVNTPRGSSWTPTLTSYPTIPNLPSNVTYHVEYLTNRAIASVRCNGADIQREMEMDLSSDPPMYGPYQPCLTETAAVDDIPDRYGAGGWLTLASGASAQTLASVVAMKIVIDISGAGLVPGDDIGFLYQTRTAWVPDVAQANLAQESVAYNSIAAAAIGVLDSSDYRYRFVTEPRKAGVAMAMGEVSIAKELVDANGFAGSVFNVSLSCRSGVESVPLVTSTGAARSPFALTAGAPARVVKGIPLYAKCDVGETDYGQTDRSFSPPIVVAQAPVIEPSALDVGYVIFDPNPAYDVASRPALENSTVTNVYEPASLTVSKLVNTGGAINGVTYENFSYSVVCTFDNGSGPKPVRADNFFSDTMTFSLAHSGDSRTLTGLPARSQCSVDETNTRGASTVSALVTSNGLTATSSVVSTASNPAAIPVTLGADDASGDPTNSIDFTNTFAVGTLQLTKAIAGLGAGHVTDAPGIEQWGTGEFTVSVVCTSPVATPTIVYSNTFTFSSTHLSETVTGIAAGRSGASTQTTCVVSETDSAGASSVTISVNGGAATTTSTANVVLSRGESRSALITNTFDLAHLTVRKVVNTSAADQDLDTVYLDAPYVVSVSCDFEGGKVFADGYSADPMVVQLGYPGSPTDPEFVTLAGLPANAKCSATETTPTWAGSVNILLMQGSPLAQVNSFAGTTTAPGNFVLLRDNPGGRNEVQVHNNYGVSSFTVSKEILGGGTTQFDAGEAYENAEFDVHILCTFDGSTVYDDTVTLTRAAPSFTITTLVENSTCTAVESNYATSGASAVVYYHGTSATGTVIDEGDGVTLGATTQQITIQNWYLTGSITVSKELTGPAVGDYGSGPFEITLACELNGAQVQITDPVRAIVAGVDETFSALPDGASCVLTESNTGAATSSFVVRSGDLSLTKHSAVSGFAFDIDGLLTDASHRNDDDQELADAWLVNDFQYAQLLITKTVDTDAVGVEYGPFPTSVSCEFNGAPVYATAYSVNGTTVDPSGYDSSTPMQRDLEADDQWLLTGLPHGAECTVDETDTMEAVATTMHVAEGSVPATVSPVATESTSLTLLSDDPSTIFFTELNSVAIVNSYDVGSITLSKELTGDGADAWGNAQFTVLVVCELTDASGTREVWNDDYAFSKVLGAISPASVHIDNLPAGAVCTITEPGTSSGGANGTTITVDGSDAVPAIAVVDATATPDVVVTNDFHLSDILVSKIIEGPGAALYGAGPFQVTLSCTRVVNGVAETIAIPGGATRDLTSATPPAPPAPFAALLPYQALYTGLPTGAACTMVENLVGGAEISTVVETSVGAPGTFVLGASTSEVTVTNYFGDPTVFVSKALIGDGVPLYGAGPFEVTLTCTREVNGDTVPVVIPGGATRELSSPLYEAQFDFLPSGASCELSESATTGATISSISNPTFVLGNDNVVTSINVDNTFELSELRLSKVVSGPAGDAHRSQTFEVELTCALDINGVMTDIPIPGGAARSIDVDTEVVYTDLPADAECDLVETSGGGATMVVLTYNGFPVIGTHFTLASGVSAMSMWNLFSLAHSGTDVWIGGSLATLLLMAGVMFAVAGRRQPRHARGRVAVKS